MLPAPWLIGLGAFPLIGTMFLGGSVWIFARAVWGVNAFHAPVDRVVRSLIAAGRCPSCAYSIQGLPAEADGYFVVDLLDPHLIELATL